MAVVAAAYIREDRGSGYSVLEKVRPAVGADVKERQVSRLTLVPKACPIYLPTSS